MIADHFSLLRAHSPCFSHLLLHTPNILIKSNRTCCILFTYQVSRAFDLNFTGQRIAFYPDIRCDVRHRIPEFFSSGKTVFIFSIANIPRYTAIIHNPNVMCELIITSGSHIQECPRHSCCEMHAMQRMAYFSFSPDTVFCLRFTVRVTKIRLIQIPAIITVNKIATIWTLI